MNQHPLLSMLGIARRAGKLSVGFEASKEAIIKKHSRLIVVASDLSLKTEKELRYLLRDSGITVIRIEFDLLTMSAAIGQKAGCLSVDDEGLAKAVLKRHTNFCLKTI